MKCRPTMQFSLRMVSLDFSNVNGNPGKISPGNEKWEQKYLLRKIFNLKTYN